MLDPKNTTILLRRVKNRLLNGQSFHYTLLATWMLIVIQVAIITHGYSSHPALSQICYNNKKNANALPVNTCCRIHNYTKKDIHKCIEHTKELQLSMRMTDEGRFQSQRGFNETSSAEEGTFTKGSPHKNSLRIQNKITWVVVGDSRVRQVFSVLVSRLSGPRLKYKKVSSLGKWRSVHELTESLRIGKLQEDIEVQHLELPIELKFYWDPELQRLPIFLNQWNKNKNEKPSLLLIGSGLHWMKNSLHVYRTSGFVAAANKFKIHMKRLLPGLHEIADFTETIIQLQDPIQESRIFSKYQGVYSNDNINFYNSIVKSTFSKSGIITWDSNIPLTEYYNTQCEKKKQKSFDKFWNCENPLHPGFIVVEEFANMLLNNICNKVLEFGDLYCL